MQSPIDYTILDAKAATGVGNNINVADFKTIMLSYATDGGGDAALTVKFQGSIQDVSPTFSSAQSATNQWDYIDVLDAQSGSSIDGDTGVAVATADDYRLFKVNVGAYRWINARVTARTEGEITIKCMLFPY